MDGFETRTGRGDDSKGKITLGTWQFEGELIFAFLLALLLSLSLVMTLSRKGWRLPSALAVGSLPVVLCLIWIFGFRQGKTPGYDVDFLDRLFTGRHWEPSPSPLLHPSDRLGHDQRNV
jgi:hypothetical protein